MSKLQVALTIAGTDPSGGAGIMADLKSFQARGVYGMAVATSVVAQNTQGVQAICNLDQMILDEQLKSVFSDINPDAIKTGMLAEVETIECVSQYLNTMSCPYVLDPVMVATSGDRLISQEAVEALKEKLLPLATIITPNLPEAEVLFGQKLKDEDAIFKAGKSIQAKYGVKNVVIKGGHLQNEAKDFLFLENGQVQTFTSECIATKHTHGTGCTYAAVITAELAKGRSVQEAVGTAKRFITEAIRTAPELGHGNGPVNHVTYKGD
ncbi:phosphomethylpyrimidine kinase [Streptococcus infantarius subsp. infantarius]|uniref:Hydroxymethylpyrimidine/phosphomethylpyrimidine kinase n=2 Tax=Streptococcus infantarius TaxID=102684 RepID=A0A380KMI8_9STRE|nr:bifunctional hydroxymethylpyrimidine kinase/phosphomethylpyrimidine kinase [Streptococcus infantarius]AEZ62343.1 phosphomethylpyrimidine kinase [Streptococcus infantarius subsp. infantarius CJ18]MCO4648300.1 phosphomethylpyrimidine kinase [Streptococcus infantarius subsp. infantarius]EDT47571.1 phosphomethylpyrimidine kinase [Streptococcus infantarius subsp. infantarius ATCC BAA-102]MCO4650200.1 phosphomethylpyrimidine kinase [Streptococcus infantarius subsp. infantarius]MCO4653664.1 phosph